MLLFPAVGLGLAGAAVRSRRRAVRAFTIGQPALARVTYAGKDASTEINGRNPFKLAWEFEVDGRTYPGDLSTMEKHSLGGLETMKEVVVLYDPAEPGANTLWVDE